MGSGGSKAKSVASHGRPEARLAPDGKPLEEWDAEEVSAWFSTLVADLQTYRSTLLPDEGCIVAQWTEQYLATKGIPAIDAMRLITYRNKAMLRASKTKQGSSMGATSLGGSDQTVTGFPVARGSSPDGGFTAGATNVATTTTTMTATMSKSVCLHTTHSSIVQQQQQQPDAKTSTSRRESLTALLAKGVKLARQGIQHLGPSLPFPGAEAANLVVVLLDLVEGAIANHANLAQLRQRAVAFLDILEAYHEELANLRPARYKGVVDDYKELLQGIIAYTRVYCERNCIMRLLTLGSDQEQYQELADNLAALCEQVMVNVAADTNARLQAVQRSVEDAAQLLARAAEYQDPSAGARALVSELGGLDAVLGDEEKLRRVKLQLDVGSQVTIKVVESLLLSHLDRGPQRLIRHPDLRLFWMRQYASIVEVPWFDFWEQFPTQLRENPADPAVVEALDLMLAEQAARSAFERAVERGNKESVSVWELKLAFSGEEPLPPQVERLLRGGEGGGGKAAGGGGAAAAAAASVGAAGSYAAATTPGSVATATTATAAALGSSGASAGAAGAAARCQLPPLVSHYTGREEEAAAVAEHLLMRGSLVLLAPGGMGKSCLAVDVGWRLVRGGAAPGGALWVDLREASSGAEVEARFCASLGMQAEKLDNTVRILAAIKALLCTEPNGDGNGGGDCLQRQRQNPLGGATASGPGPGPATMQVLVVVDNAEDALLQPDVAEGLRALLTKILLGIPAVRLLVTSRVTLGLGPGGQQQQPQLLQPCQQLHQQQQQPAAAAAGAPGGRAALLPEHAVGDIGRQSATRLIRSVAADLTPAEAEDVAEACKCVPLLLCLVAEALVAGRLTLEDLGRLQAQAGGGGGGGSEATSSEATGGTVRLVLGSLKRQHQLAAAQLAVFPSAFDEEGAAALWASSLPQAHALLAVLQQYSVVQRSSGQHFVMHMVVRRQAAEVGRRADAGLRARVEGRFVGWMLGLLREWAAMYRTAKEWRLAMTIAREHQADVSKLLELLGSAAAPTAAAAGGQQGGKAAGEEGGCCWDAADVAAACTDDLRQMLEGLGLLRRMETPCLELLRRLGDDSCAADDDDDGSAPPRPPSSLPPTQPLTLQTLQLEPQTQPQGQQQPQQPQRWRSTRVAEEQLSLPPLQPPLEAGTAEPAASLQPQPQQQPQQQQQQQAPSEKERRRQLAVAAVLFMLAWVRVRGGRQYGEAEQDARRSWELRAALLGLEHPDSVVSMYILAAALGYLRRYSEAEELNRQVLAIQLRLLGRSHADTAYSINGLAVCVDKQGRFAEAEAMYREALDIRREVLGERHPATAGSVNNLAGSIYFQGRRPEAEALYRQALDIRRAVLGEEHPDTLCTLANLTGCITDGGRLLEAEPLLRQTLALRERALGPDHPDTLASLASLAECVYGMEDREREAEALYRRVVAASVAALGRGHPATRGRLLRLGGCVEAQGRVFDAEEVLEELAAEAARGAKPS